MKANLIFALGLLIGLTGLPTPQTPGGAEPYESYFMYLGDYPDEANPGWHENVQGLDHDDSHWFITQTEKLWKIPVTHDLARPASTNPDTRLVTIQQIADLASAGCDHLGDPDHYVYAGKGYLLVPVEGCFGGPAIAVFDSSVIGQGGNWGYLGRARLGAQSEKAGWVAVDSAGAVYSSHCNTTTLYKYTLAWARLPGEVLLEYSDTLPLRDESGADLKLITMQGGEFSESGGLLYLTSGYRDSHHTNDGINVLDTRTWQRVRRSSVGDMPFKYEFHPGWWESEEEPEGLTIWNLDDGRAPGVRGALHVLLLDNDASEGDPDDVYIKHYSEAISVDASYAGGEEGTPGKPFNTVAEAYALAWNGQRIQIRSGSYGERLSLGKRMEMSAAGGTVVIGR
jgi:hypothetical protein